jgi:Tfp pilus assembly protein PilF
MDAFSALKYITSGLTLIGFIVAVAARLIRRTVIQRERLIHDATPDQRIQMATVVLERFGIDTKDIGPEQKYELALAQLQARTSRLRTLLVFSVMIALIAAATTITLVYIVPHKPTDPHKEMVSITLDEYRQLLETRQAAITSVSYVAQGDIGLTNAERAAIQDRKDNIAQSYDQYRATLSRIQLSLDNSSSQLNAEQVEVAKTQLAHGNTSAAEKLLKGALSQQTKNAADAAFQLGSLAESRVDFRAATEYYLKAVDLDATDPSYLQAAADISYQIGRYPEALSIYTRALEIVRSQSGPNSAQLGALYNRRGQAYFSSGDLRNATDDLTKARDILEFAEPQGIEIAEVYDNLGGVNSDFGNFSNAQQQYAISKSRFEAILGDRDEHVGNLLNNSGIAYVYAFQYKEAEQALRSALDIQEHAIGPEDPLVGIVLCNLGELCFLTDRYSEAETDLSKARSIIEYSLGGNHPQLARVLARISELYERTGRVQEAEVLCIRALAIQKATLDPRNQRIADTLRILGDIYCAEKRNKDAETMLYKSRDLLMKATSDTNPFLASVLSDLGDLFLAEGSVTQALEAYQTALNIREQAFGSKNLGVQLLTSKMSSLQAKI